MAVHYQEAGIEFLYPENWEFIEEADSEAVVDVTLQSPQTGIWTMQVYPNHPGRASLCTGVLESLKQEYSDLEATPVSRDFGGREAFGFELAFFCLDFLISARVFEFTDAQRRIVVLYQAEHREYQEAEPVFEAITTSLWTQPATN